MPRTPSPPRALGHLRQARRAYQKIDATLRENNAVGVTKRANGTKILAFPGRKLVGPKAVVVREHAEVDGIVVRVGG